MALLITALQILIAILALLAALLSILFLVKLRWPAPFLWMLKLYTSALSTVFLCVAFLSVIIGLLTGAMWLAIVGVYDLLIFSQHIYLVTRPPQSSDFALSLIPDDLKKNQTRQKAPLLNKRIVLRLPTVPEPRFEQNIPFADISDTGRKLLCDIWRPPVHVPSSGLAFIYLHGGGWCILDKDLGTRPLFRRLASQGHVIMDVAYRLSPETDMSGMIHDAKRAIAWMKENAGNFEIDPDRIVIGGGSSGAHLALMAAYTKDSTLFNPKELAGRETSVCAVISFYGPADLTAMYYHTNQHLTTRDIPGKPREAVPSEMPAWVIKKMGKEYYRLGFDKGFVNTGTFAPLLGGHPDECPDTYALYSPIMHVHPHCPPTLLIHGEHDVMAPIKSTRLLFNRLKAHKVPVTLHILPQSEHAFDLQLPRISHAAHSAIYDIEHFLDIMSQGKANRQLTNMRQRNEALIA